MTDKKRETLLKIMSIIAIFLCVYPLTSVVRISLFKESKELLDGFFYLVVSLSTFIAVSLIMHKNQTRKDIVLAYGYLIIPIIASIIYFFSFGILSTIFGAFITAILCLFTIRVYFKGYNYLISGAKLYVGIVMLLLALAFSTYFEELKYLKNQFYIFTFIYAFSLLVIRNQSNLDSIFSKRFDKASGIPEKMRSYNIKKIIVFFLLIVGFFYFRDVLIAGLQGLLGLLGFILRILWSFFGTIMEKLREFLIVEETDLPSSPDMGYPIDGGNGGNPIVNMVCNIIAILLIAFTVYKIATVLIINVLIPFLKNTYKRLLEKIINFFEKTEHKEEKTHYYTDRIERVIPSAISKKSAKPKEIPKISRALKQMEKIENPKEKVKYLYGFILKCMSAKGVDIKKSYTTEEIYKKAKEINQLDAPLREITSLYDRVKYGDKMPKDSQVDDAKSNTIKSIEIINKI